MNALRYKFLLSYLPGMASVVNAFASPQVQNSVYETLMEALEAKLKAEGLGTVPGPTVSREAQRVTTPSSAPVAGGDVAHDLIEGESIHGDTGRSGIAMSTVF